MLYTYTFVEGYKADYTAKKRCIELYTDTRCLTALHSYTAIQRCTALYIIQLYSAIHYTTSTTPLWSYCVTELLRYCVTAVRGIALPLYCG